MMPVFKLKGIGTWHMPGFIHTHMDVDMDMERAERIDYKPHTIEPKSYG